jgi:1-acyl-sn-glycerol-3-phosphate acyltransferase
MKWRQKTLAGLHTGFEYLAMLAGLGMLTLLCLLGLPVAVVLLIFPARLRVATGRRLITVTFGTYLAFLRLFCGVKLDTRALDALQHTRPLIIVANHPSLLDAVILLSKLPHATCVMKGSLRRNILFGPTARLAGYVSNHDPAEMIRQACAALAGGSQLLIFPEGTRTEQFPVNPFTETSAFISRRSGVSIQTVVIEFSSPYLGKGWPLFKRPALPLCITVAPGKKFAPADDRVGITKQLESYFAGQLTHRTMATTQDDESGRL